MNFAQSDAGFLELNNQAVAAGNTETDRHQMSQSRKQEGKDVKTSAPQR